MATTGLVSPSARMVTLETRNNGNEALRRCLDQKESPAGAGPIGVAEKLRE